MYISNAMLHCRFPNSTLDDANQDCGDSKSAVRTAVLLEKS